MYRLKPTRMANGIGLLLPDELVAAMGLTEATELSLIRAGDDLRITPFDATLDEQMRFAERVMERFPALAGGSTQ
ncbi:hypothetical protein SAMN05216548_11830 [Faunimonas pinastri]|uniref:SpoVT-AbrB domain-containing protein n=1 Tax=Faunimonas pinastri TaxID=1855383 RepID=A0A1H9P243_9HYPH|nr:AbrB/MazE/SpoVT family DNA-binding domain-containing protein [Faunimonas pinastri]SER42181.1 hypothetical protein SAMN05216548_11830 [Faunimonas pinastri]